jgi:hypothetical protein
MCWLRVSSLCGHSYNLDGTVVGAQFARLVGRYCPHRFDWFLFPRVCLLNSTDISLASSPHAQPPDSPPTNFFGEPSWSTPASLLCPLPPPPHFVVLRLLHHMNRQAPEGGAPGGLLLPLRVGLPPPRPGGGAQSTSGRNSGDRILQDWGTL